MNTQVWCLNSLFVWQAEWTVNSMPVRNTERMMFSSIHNVEMPSKMPYLLFMFISSPQLPESQTIATCSLPESQKLCLEITVFARLIAECLEIKIVSAVNQICRFASTMKKKFTRKLTVACHRHPTELPISKHREREYFWRNSICLKCGEILCIVFDIMFLSLLHACLVIAAPY